MSIYYVKAAIDIVKEAINCTSRMLLSKVQTPIVSGYIPELDGTTKLGAKDITFHQGIIGVLRW